MKKGKNFYRPFVQNCCAWVVFIVENFTRLISITLRKYTVQNFFKNKFFTIYGRCTCVSWVWQTWLWWACTRDHKNKYLYLLTFKHSGRFEARFASSVVSFFYILYLYFANSQFLGVWSQSRLVIGANCMTIGITSWLMEAALGHYMYTCTCTLLHG